ncbi:MAG TPA: putative dsRNA-binding protein, partial [Limnochordia bacterium]
VGAIYLERGFRAARRFVLRQLADRLAETVTHRAFVDPKGALQEHLQRQRKETPVYTLREATGPDHARLYVSEVSFGGRILGRGQGRSKKAAEQAAARRALRALGAEGSGEAEQSETDR